MVRRKTAMFGMTVMAVGCTLCSVLATLMIM